jgi:hypothetical protein
MSQSSGKIYVPPYSTVRLLECRDHIQLAPVPVFRVFYGYGKVKASEVVIELEDGKSEPFWDNCTPNEEAWAVVQWFRFEDGHEESGSIHYLRWPKTEDDARRAMQDMSDFYSMSKEEMLILGRLVEDSEDNDKFMEGRYPNYQSAPSDPLSVEYKVYQARLKTLAALQPKTVKLIKLADATKDPQKRQKIEREAVQAFFAEVAQCWTEDQLSAWLKSNPPGAKWLHEFGKMLEKPERELDPINQELALNWLHRGYNLMTEKELSVAIKNATGKDVKPNTVKKKRTDLGLPTKRNPGPKPKSER